MADNLPESSVEVITDTSSSNEHRTTIVVKREGSRDVIKTGEGDTSNGATARAVKGLLKDPHILEHIDRQKS
jgi:hypothetical protein